MSMITFVASDGGEVTVDRDAALQSNVIKDMLELVNPGDSPEPIPIPSVHPKQTAKQRISVVRYANGPRPPSAFEEAFKGYYLGPKGLFEVIRVDLDLRLFYSQPDPIQYLIVERLDPWSVRRLTAWNEKYDQGRPWNLLSYWKQFNFTTGEEFYQSMTESIVDFLGCLIKSNSPHIQRHRMEDLLDMAKTRDLNQVLKRVKYPDQYFYDIDFDLRFFMLAYFQRVAWQNLSACIQNNHDHHNVSYWLRIYKHASPYRRETLEIKSSDIEPKLVKLIAKSIFDSDETSVRDWLGPLVYFWKTSETEPPKGYYAQWNRHIAKRLSLAISKGYPFNTRRGVDIIKFLERGTGQEICINYRQWDSAISQHFVTSISSVELKASQCWCGIIKFLIGRPGKPHDFDLPHFTHLVSKNIGGFLSSGRLGSAINWMGLPIFDLGPEGVELDWDHIVDQLETEISLNPTCNAARWIGLLKDDLPGLRLELRNRNPLSGYTRQAHLINRLLLHTLSVAGEESKLPIILVKNCLKCIEILQQLSLISGQDFPPDPLVAWEQHIQDKLLFFMSNSDTVRAAERYGRTSGPAYLEGNRRTPSPTTSIFHTIPKGHERVTCSWTEQANWAQIIPSITLRLVDDVRCHPRPYWMNAIEELCNNLGLEIQYDRTMWLPHHEACISQCLTHPRESAVNVARLFSSIQQIHKECKQPDYVARAEWIEKVKNLAGSNRSDRQSWAKVCQIFQKGTGEDGGDSTGGKEQ
ncbi:hypothetical protein CIHG_10243 [Coccidioides immitis H538.4]|uniref:E3 ubiquitin ligase complex SCF subunit sconC n=1 Tax=Coccidioides immitis H538.4 TaxID=396776 RepID=A0A0J8S7Z5_COCIT|nr:hypothetical protein CIHG_10243 [Coccidioides immitis H538.4]